MSTATPIFKGYWRSTYRKVAKAQVLRTQAWFARHPITFGAAWGTKALVYDLPAWGVRSGYRKFKGRKKSDAVAVAEGRTTSETVTEIETVDSAGNISTTTATTRHTEFPFPGTAGASEPFVMAPPAQVGAPTAAADDTGRPTLVLVEPIERKQIMDASRDILMRRRLGHAFLGLANEFDQFTPVRGNEAASTVEMVHDAYMGFKRISMGVETFAEVVAALGLHRGIVNGLYGAAGSADGLDRVMRRANTQVVALYEGQIEQDHSQAVTVAAIPVPVGAGIGADGIGPYAAAVATGYETFAPPADTEATEIFEYIRVSQAGFAVLSDSLGRMAKRMHQHGIDARVRRLIRAAGADALGAASQFQASRRTMSRLYRGQMAQEASGVATIRTAPMRRAG